MLVDLYISWFVFLMVCSVYYSGVSQAAVGCVCFDGKEMLTKLTWSHSGIISCADLLKITMKYQTVIYPLSLMSVLSYSSLWSRLLPQEWMLCFLQVASPKSLGSQGYFIVCFLDGLFGILFRGLTGSCGVCLF